MSNQAQSYYQVEAAIINAAAQIATAGQPEAWKTDVEEAVDVYMERFQVAYCRLKQAIEQPEHPDLQGD